LTFRYANVPKTTAEVTVRLCNEGSRISRYEPAMD